MGRKQYKIDGQKTIWSWCAEYNIKLIDKKNIKLMDRQQFEVDGSVV